MATINRADTENLAAKLDGELIAEFAYAVGEVEARRTPSAPGHADAIADARSLRDELVRRLDAAAALRRLVAALDDDSAMTGFNWRTTLTRPPYEDDEPDPLAEAWAEVARVCPVATNAGEVDDE